MGKADEELLDRALVLVRLFRKAGLFLSLEKIYGLRPSVGRALSKGQECLGARSQRRGADRASNGDALPARRP